MARILHVDDEENIRLLYQMELEAEGHEVVSARDGKEALDMARVLPPDVVIMDISLPDRMDGLEAMSRILSEDKNVSVILNSSYSQYMDNFQSWLADAFVLKSADLSPLKVAVQDLLARKTSERAGELCSV